MKGLVNYLHSEGLLVERAWCTPGPTQVRCFLSKYVIPSIEPKVRGGANLQEYLKQELE